LGHGGSPQDHAANGDLCGGVRADPDCARRAGVVPLIGGGAGDAPGYAVGIALSNTTPTNTANPTQWFKRNARKQPSRDRSLIIVKCQAAIHAAAASP